jgi:F-type H+-transporting ATPase subunit alpha
MPFRLVDEVALMLAVQAGLLDPLPLNAVAAFRTALPAQLDKNAPETLSALTETGALGDEVRKHLMEALTELATSLAGEKKAAKPDTIAADGQ